MRYTVKEGDTLKSISQQYLGSGDGALTLWVINKVSLKSGTPTTIYAGEIIDIPDQWTGAAQPVPTGVDPNELLLYVNGQQYGGWLEAQVTRSMEAVSGSFTVSLTDVWEQDAEPYQISKGDEVKVCIGSDVVLTGYIDIVNVSYDATTHTMSISGRDKTCDIVDCSVLNRPGEFRNKTVEEIARALCAPYNVKVYTDVTTGSAVDLFRCEPGETVFTALERLARGRNLLVSCSDDGNVLLTRSGRVTIPTSLIEGVNIMSFNMQDDGTDRFSTYIVEGQADGQDKKKHSFRGTAYDPAIKRLRTTIVMAEDKADQAYADRRAQWEARVRAAKSQSIDVTVQGWRTETGDLWNVNRITHITSPKARLDDDLLITDVDFTLNSGGSTTGLTLKRKDIYLAESELKETDDILNAKKQAMAAKKKAKKRKKGSGGVVAQIIASPL